MNHCLSGEPPLGERAIQRAAASDIPQPVARLPVIVLLDRFHRLLVRGRQLVPPEVILATHFRYFAGNGSQHRLETRPIEMRRRGADGTCIIPRIHRLVLFRCLFGERVGT